MGRASIARRILALCAVLPLVVAACGKAPPANTAAWVRPRQVARRAETYPTRTCSSPR